MKERPILFTAEMVNAIREGRKAQTRRKIKSVAGHGAVTDLRKSQDSSVWSFRNEKGRLVEMSKDDFLASCPYGAPRDRAWVKETFAIIWKGAHGCPGHYDSGACEWLDVNKGFCDHHERIEYRADTGNALPGDWPADQRDDPYCPNWRSSIYMPRWASRLNLVIRDIRAENLQDISKIDAMREGMPSSNGAPDDYGLPTEMVVEPVNEFHHQWKKINGPGSWDENPLVWVIDFLTVGKT